MTSALLIAAAFIGFVALFGRRHWRRFREDTADVWADAKAQWDEGVADIRAKQAAEEEAKVAAWYRGLAKPALLLHPEADANPEAAAARLGGPVWLAEGEDWPRDPAGRPLEFVALLDFAQLPPLAGFPQVGVARFFVGRDDIFGVDFDRPEAGAARVLWHDGPRAGGRLEAPFPWLPDEGSPFESEAIRDRGLALVPRLIEDIPDPFSWQVTTRPEPGGDTPEARAREDLIFALAEEREEGHRIGGHPSFTQYDFREPGKHDEFDTQLLGLTSDDAIMWGDVGEAMFMIRSEDLARRDFSRVAFYWDCH